MAEGIKPNLSHSELPEGTVTFLFTDIEGSTELLRELKDQYASLLADQRRILREIFTLWNGQEVDMQGDEFFYSFPRATDAVNAAVDVQGALARHTWPDDVKVRVRIGVHTGEPLVEEEGYVGIDVHRAARIGSIGHGGQVLLSETTTSLVRDELPEGVGLEDLGLHCLKNIQRPERIHQLISDDLVSEFPPLKSIGADLSITPPHNLPSEITSFVGRERELEALGVMISDPKVRLVTILGAGGVGKTRLALAFAESQLAVTHRINGKTDALYPHGIYFNPLAPLESVDSIVHSLAENLGFRLSEKRDPEKQLIDFLRHKEMILIIDNFEHLLDGTEIVAEILRSASGIKVLVTSRTPLNISGEHRFQLKGLDFPETTLLHLDEAARFSSIELYRQCACRTQVDFDLTDDNINDITRICQLLEGMPLGVRLAATWTDILSPTGIANEIEHGLELLETEVHDMPKRHSSMRAVFDHSWNLLSDSEREVLGGLSVFRGGFTRNAAEQVTGASLRDLKTLANKSLVNPTPNQRFEMHELLRQYIVEKHKDSPDKLKSINEHHCAYYTTLLKSLDMDLKSARQVEALGEIELEIANLRVAWSYAVEMGKVEQLYQAVNGLCRFYLWRRRFKEGEEACIAVAERFTTTPPDKEASMKTSESFKLLARIMTWQSVFCEHAKSKSLVEKVLWLLETSEVVDIDVKRERAFALQQLGDLTIDFDRDEAQRIYEQSHTLYKALEDSWGAARVLTALGWVRSHKGELHEARHLGEESLKLQRSISDKKGIADTLWLLGTNAIIGGFVKEASQLISESLNIRQALGDRIIDIASGPVDLGMTLTWIGRIVEAKEVREETLAMYKDQGIKERIAMAHVRLGVSNAHLGEYEETYVNAKNGLVLGRETDNQRAIGLALFMLGGFENINKVNDEAYALYEESISILRRIEGAGELGWTLSLIALNEHRRGEHDKARTHLSEALQIGSGILATATAWFAIPVISVILADKGHVERAIELYTLASRYPLVTESYLWQDLFGKYIDEAITTLSEETVAEAEVRGRARDLHDTISEIIAELEDNPEKTT